MQPFKKALKHEREIERGVNIDNIDIDIIFHFSIVSISIGKCMNMPLYKSFVKDQVQVSTEIIVFTYLVSFSLSLQTKREKKGDDDGVR